jgi:ribosomal protein S18 acetylase RimI-like enzyme
MPLSIRLATLADAPVVAEFNRLLAAETEGKTLDPVVLARGVTACLADPAKGIYYVAEENGAVLGQIGLTYEWSDWRNAWFWWIQSVYVRREARRRGVFRALYEHVHRAALADPTVVGLRLYVEKDNEVAKRTYLQLGMEEMGFILLHRWPLATDAPLNG